MKQILKNAIVYKAHLPVADLLRQHLAERPFTEPMSLEASSAGFVPVGDMADTVVTFEGGLAFAVRQDVKVVPGSAVKAEVEKRVQAIEKERGFRPGRKERKEIKEAVHDSLLAKAMCRSTVVTCLYDPATQHLFVGSGSKAMADTVTGLLIKTVGSVKTETIHISDIKHGLTTRLGVWLGGDTEVFDPLQPADTVALKKSSEKLTVHMTDLAQAEKALTEAIQAGFVVASMGMQHGDTTSFRLTSDFHLKSIALETPPTEGSGPMTNDELWLHQAAIEVLYLSRVVTSLCELLGYKAPNLEADDAEQAEEVAA